MITQMENQDPLSPQDNSQFITQLAQFSSVEGIDNLNTSIASMSSGMKSTLALQASTLVGRTVRVPSNAGNFDGSAPMSGDAVLPGAGTDVRVRVFDSTGAQVQQLELGTNAAGDVPFSWNGTDADGNALPAGRYTFKAEGNFGNGTAAADVELNANVNSVSIGTDGAVTLNVAGVGAVPLASVRQVN
jgi:flagellar basal-body rod modification protein FlgD